MFEIYISGTEDLATDRESLDVLRRSGVIAGIELADLMSPVDMVKDAGLKISTHTPGLDMTMNLADPGLINAFTGRNSKRLLDFIRRSDAPTVGFHCGYSAESVYKMRGYPNVPKDSRFINHRESLLERIASNVSLLERMLNSEVPWCVRKQVVLETLDYSRNRPVPWDIQIREVIRHAEAIEETVAEYGINAGLRYVTDPDFIGDVLDITRTDSIIPPGFLFDVSHNYISADTKRHEESFSGFVEEYFNCMLGAVAGRTYQMHLSVPEGDSDRGYGDYHRIFTPGDRLSDEIMALAKGVVAASPSLHVLTLEMYTYRSRLEHAREMVKQAEYVLHSLT